MLKIQILKKIRIRETNLGEFKLRKIIISKVSGSLVMMLKIQILKKIRIRETNLREFKLRKIIISKVSGS